MNRWIFGAVSIGVFATACAGVEPGDEASASAEFSEFREAHGAVFTLTNEAAGNRVLAFSRMADGSLMEPAAYATAGLGSGNSLGSQSALVLSGDHRFLLAVNAGSHDVSSFEVRGATLTQLDRVASGGQRPVSITERDGLVYVLNAGDADTAGNVSGFYLTRHGRLRPIPLATQPLSAAAVGPAQVELSPDGRNLVVTEKATNKIDTYRVAGSGRIGGPEVHASAGTTPFGFEFTDAGELIVSEAATGSMSAYAFSHRGGLELVNGPVSDTQKAPCWVAISQDNRYAFTTNAASSSISSYRIGRFGKIELNDARAGETGEGSRPLDMAFSDNGHYLYVLDIGNLRITTFQQRRGALEFTQTLGELPATSAGLAAY